MADEWRKQWSDMERNTAGNLVSGFSVAVLEQIEKILDAPQQPQQLTRLQRNIELLRKEKEYWKNFMEADEWNRETIREVETAWRKRSQVDQPTELMDLATLEQLTEKVKEPVQEKTPPHARPLRRSHTDPTDLLWVFRRRSSMLAYRPQQTAPSRQNGCTEPCRTEQDDEECQTETSKERKSRQEHMSCSESQALREDQREEIAPEKAEESSSDSETRETVPYELEWTAMPLTHHDQPRRKISAPAYRPARRESVLANHMATRRTCSLSTAPRRRRGSEAPALTVIARRRNSQSLAFPAGLRRKNSRVNAPDHQLSIQAKAKHEMLANLVLPAFVDEPPFRTRERRNTFTFQAASMRTKKDEKRYQVAKEILDTEKKYLSCLRALKEVFEGPMRETNLIPSKEIDVLFPGELVHILKSHTLFMKDLEERLQNWKLQGIVGDIFTKLSGSYHIDVLRIYSNYVNNFPRAIAVINKSSRGSQKFRKFLQNCSSNSECEGLDLPAFLLTPIQRLPRYVLLLRQLSKYTDSGHPDSFHIENALETMKQMINVLNDSIQNSCKLANNSQVRRSFKRKSLRKKGRELQKGKKDSQENDSFHRVSLESSSVSTISMDSAFPSPVCLQDVPTEQNHSQVGSGEDSVDTRSRPVSTSELESFVERDNQEEFAAIEEEEKEDLKDSKGSGQSKFRMAADSFKRNWQRRSKKWRRSGSVDEPADRHDELDIITKEKDNDDSLHESPTGSFNEMLKDENGNVNETPPRSPSRTLCRKHAVVSPIRTRPSSLVLPSEFYLIRQENRLKDRVQSDTDLSKDNAPPRSPDVWVPRQRKRVLQRTRSDGVRNFIHSRNSSVASGDTSSMSGSKKSLSRISQESLADSGVSETPGSSPSNTLNCRTRKISVMKREGLSMSLTNVASMNETKRKLSQINRRSWGDWVSAEMESEASGAPVEGSEPSYENNSKSKRKFKDVVKKIFGSKKKHNSSQLEESTPHAKSSNKITAPTTPTEIGEKISTV